MRLNTERVCCSGHLNNSFFPMAFICRVIIRSTRVHSGFRKLITYGPVSNEPAGIWLYFYFFVGCVEMKIITLPCVINGFSRVVRLFGLGNNVVGRWRKRDSVEGAASGAVPARTRSHHLGYRVAAVTVAADDHTV